MQFIIELEPETEAAVRAKATARGLRVEEYLRSLAKQAVGLPDSPIPAALQDRLRAWDELSEPIEGLPNLADSDLSREVIYGDHD